VSTGSQKKEDHSKLILRVAEISSRDAWRGIARLDPYDMEKIGVRTGDIIITRRSGDAMSFKLMVLQDRTWESG